MFFQKVLKGINNLSLQEANSIVNNAGISCNLWRLLQEIYNSDIKNALNEQNIFYHLNDYDKPVPTNHPFSGKGNNLTYGDVTPFISTTAGAIQRSDFQAKNIIFPPFVTALQFATDNFKSDGYVFFTYVITIGKKSIPLRQFSEEVRELHIYQQYLPFHHEGEIMAKIDIPSVQIEKAEHYHGPTALSQWKQNQQPVPTVGRTIVNHNYARPENHTNIRELL